MLFLTLKQQQSEIGIIVPADVPVPDNARLWAGTVLTNMLDLIFFFKFFLILMIFVNIFASQKTLLRMAIDISQDVTSLHYM